jgi:hypothetical protein
MSNPCVVVELEDRGSPGEIGWVITRVWRFDDLVMANEFADLMNSAGRECEVHNLEPQPEYIFHPSSALLDEEIPVSVQTDGLAFYVITPSGQRIYDRFDLNAQYFFKVVSIETIMTTSFKFVATPVYALYERRVTVRKIK